MGVCRVFVRCYVQTDEDALLEMPKQQLNIIILVYTGQQIQNKIIVDNLCSSSINTFMSTRQFVNLLLSVVTLRASGVKTHT